MNAVLWWLELPLSVQLGAVTAVGWVTQQLVRFDRTESDLERLDRQVTS